MNTEHSAFVFMIAKINPEADLKHSFKFKSIFFKSEIRQIYVRISVDTFLIWKTH